MLIRKVAGVMLESQYWYRNGSFKMCDGFGFWIHSADMQTLKGKGILWMNPADMQTLNCNAGILCPLLLCMIELLNIHVVFLLRCNSEFAIQNSEPPNPLLGTQKSQLTTLKQMLL